MARSWSGVLARLGTPTGDGRIIAPGSLDNRALPLPLMWQELSSDGHGGSAVVGRIESLDYTDGGLVRARGSLLDSAPPQVIEQLEAGVIGPSVDLDDIEYQMDDTERVVITRGRIAGATLVSIPAFADVGIALDAEPGLAEPYDAPYFVTASVRSAGWSDLPIADESRPWDGQAAADRVFSWATTDGNTDWARYARAFLRKDDNANPETRGAYGFGIADVIDGELEIIPRGVFAAAAATQGARGNGKPEDAEGMQSVLRGIYDRMGRDAPFSLAAAAGAPLPPAAWFEQPDLDGPTPVTVSDTGRVFGHIATWGACHVGLPGCVTPPVSYASYAYFHQAQQQTADGSTLPVGTLVAGPRHADPQAAFQAAAAHYDDPAAAVARVVAGEDEHGIWVAGWLLPGAPEAAKEVFRSSPVSGDGRQIGGHLELIAVCSVNAPGFPVARARVAFSLGMGQRTLIGVFATAPVVGEYVAKPAKPQANLSVARARLALAVANRKG